MLLLVLSCFFDLVSVFGDIAELVRGQSAVLAGGIGAGECGTEG